MPALPPVGGGTADLPTTPRGESSKKLLKLDWNYPTYTEVAEQTDGRSNARSVRKMLAASAAVKFLAADDKRPLLVLRECLVCNGTDKALLSQGVDNERTFLLARYFRCVKLPADVLKDDHPFRKLFGDKNVEHLFLSAYDGSGKVPLESERSRTELWGHMRSVLNASYGQDVNALVDQTLKHLDKLDQIDLRQDELEHEIDQALEKDGPKSKRIGKVKAKLAELDLERKAVMAKIEALSQVTPKPVVEPGSTATKS